MGQELKPAPGQGCCREQVGSRESTTERGEPKMPGMALLPSSWGLGAAAPARLPGDAPSLAASLGCDSVSPSALELWLCLGAAHAQQDEAPLASQHAPELEQPHNLAALRGRAEPSHLLGFARR